MVYAVERPATRRVLKGVVAAAAVAGLILVGLLALNASVAAENPRRVPAGETR